MKATVTSSVAATGRTASHRTASRSAQLSIVIPTYNEAQTLPLLLQRIEAAVVGKNIPTEIWVMDDRSPDGTADVARRCATRVPVRVVERDGPWGLAAAVAEGFRYATGEFVLVMDADLQHPPEAIPALVRAMHEGADFVIGSRYTQGGSVRRFGFLRKLNSWGATWLARPLIPPGVHDPMSGFFCLRRSSLENADIRAVGFKIGLELLVKTRAQRVVEVPITFGARHAGVSKLGAREQFRYLRHLLGLYAWRFPAAGQFARFCAVGACGMTLDLGLMAALMSGGVQFAAARAWSVLAAMTLNFFLNRRYTFPDRRGPVASQFLRFTGACATGLVVNWGLSSALYAAFPARRGLYPLMCAAGIAAGTFINFFFSRSYAFADAAARPGSKGAQDGADGAGVKPDQRKREGDQLI
ncbi:MAG: Undecaprenyl-phosphate 4-deoxy-4-formamido-L-arabinose transferase [Phycisphaerae bacterium]|nr:Undecaprenyl-phosphate 4-deoxy-4-formamido-L-arabinose transferase [Phycisphaerae bacterium]